MSVIYIKVVQQKKQRWNKSGYMLATAKLSGDVWVLIVLSFWIFCMFDNFSNNKFLKSVHR